MRRKKKETLPGIKVHIKTMLSEKTKMIVQMETFTDNIINILSVINKLLTT